MKVVEKKKFPIKTNCLKKLNPNKAKCYWTQDTMTKLGFTITFKFFFSKTETFKSTIAKDS